jgi:hypothetical protein
MIRQIKSRRMRWAGHKVRMGEEKKMYRVLVGKPEGKRPLGRPKHRWKDGIRMNLMETGWGSVYWIHLAQDRWRALVHTAMNLWVLAPWESVIPMKLSAYFVSFSFSSYYDK